MKRKIKNIKVRCSTVEKRTVEKQGDASYGLNDDSACHPCSRCDVHTRIDLYTYTTTKSK